MRIYAVIILFLLSSCSPVTTSPLNTNTILNTPVISNATATPNYQVTLDVVSTQAGYARSTADAAFEIGIQATDNHEERQQELAQIAQDNVLLTNQSNIWTVTAAGTSIPLTQTQQVIINTQIAGVQTQNAGQMTMVKEQPTQIVAITRAKNSNQTWWIEFLVRIFVFIGMGIFFISIGVFVAKYNPPPPVNKVEFVDRDITPSDFVAVPVEYYGDTLSSANIQEDPKNTETTVEVDINPNTSYPAKDIYKFPCTPEQLDELANKTIVQGLSLAYDNFAGKGSLFTRETYAPVYSFMLRHRLSMSTGIKLDGKNKGVILTGKEIGEVNGQDVLAQWLASRTLLGTFTVDDIKPLPSSVHTPVMTSPMPLNIPHTQENIGMLEDRGSGLTPLRDLNNE